MSTSEDLQAAFAGESQANRKYLAYAKQAEADGYPQIARLFRAAAEAETVHAHAHLRAMGGIGTTGTNIQAAIDGEGFEFREMYPPYLAEAQKEGHKAAALSFRHALAVEQVDHTLYSEAQQAFNSGSDLPATSVFVCSVCGYTVKDAAPDKCPVCSASKDKFVDVR